MHVRHALRVYAPETRENPGHCGTRAGGGRNMVHPARPWLAPSLRLVTPSSPPWQSAHSVTCHLAMC
jgi:hypothetical protein